MSTIAQITKNAAASFEEYILVSNGARAAFLESIADNIEALGDTLLEQASKETNLPIPRLQGERGRRAGVNRVARWRRFVHLCPSVQET